ncbi:hypothetical protein N9W34_06280 [Rickettsiales bacterium]|nr:hypothetical protein [Rickettsiales bacterium]
MSLQEEDLRKIVRETVHETLIGLGMGAQEPQELQSDFIYIRKIRKGSEDIARKVRASIITVTIPTFLYLLWETIKTILVKIGG